MRPNMDFGGGAFNWFVNGVIAFGTVISVAAVSLAAWLAWKYLL